MTIGHVNPDKLELGDHLRYIVSTYVIAHRMMNCLMRDLQFINSVQVIWSGNWIIITKYIYHTFC